MPDSDCSIHHFVWADNLFIIAATKNQFHIMVQELTDAIYRHTLRWKGSSLKYLRTGPVDEGAGDADCVDVIVAFYSHYLQTLGLTRN